MQSQIKYFMAPEHLDVINDCIETENARCSFLSQRIR